MGRGRNGIREASEDVEQGSGRAVLGYLAKTRWPTRKPGHFSAVGKAGLGKDNSQPNLEDGHRCQGSNRTGRPPGKLREQGPVGADYTDERRA